MSNSYHFLKASEGGPVGGRTGMIKLLKASGIEAKPIHSPYVGHAAVEVVGGKRAQRAAAKIIFG